MYKPTFAPPRPTARPNLKRPAVLFHNQDEDEDEDADANSVRILDDHHHSSESETYNPEPPKKHPTSTSKSKSMAMFSPRPKKRTRLFEPQPLDLNHQAVAGSAASASASASSRSEATTSKPKPILTAIPQTPRKSSRQFQLFPSTPSSSSSRSIPTNECFTYPYPYTQTYTPYPPHASDSPSNPLGPARAHRLKRTIPGPTSLAKHVVLRFQLVCVGVDENEGAREGKGKGEDIHTVAREREREGGRTSGNVDDTQEEEEEEGQGEEEAEEDTPARQGGVHRIVRVPMSYTFTHLKCLIAWLFDEDAGPESLTTRNSDSRRFERRDTWFDDDEEDEDDCDYERNNDEEDHKEEDEDEEDPSTFSSSPSPSSSSKRSSLQPNSNPTPYPYLFEVQNKVSTYSPLYKPGQIKTGVAFVKLSSVRDPAAARRQCAGGEGEREREGEEDELFLDLDEGGGEGEGKENEEEEEEWKWADEEDFTLGHVFPRGIDGEIGIVYHHSPTIQIHMTVNKSPVAAQKGQANTPFVFSAQGHTTARLSPPHLVPVMDRCGGMMKRRRRVLPLPLPKPVFSKTVEDILSSSPGHYSKAQVRSRARERALVVDERRSAIAKGKKRAREEEDVEGEIWSPFLFAGDGDRRRKRRRVQEDEDVEEDVEEGDVEEEEEIEDEEEAILSDTDADGEPDCEVDEEGKDLHDLDESHPFLFAEAEGSSPMKLVREDDEEEGEAELDERRDEIVLASDSEDSMYDEDGEGEYGDGVVEQEEEEDVWNARDAFLGYLKMCGFEEAEEEEGESDDDEMLNRRKRDDDEDEDDDVDDDDDDDAIVPDAHNPSSTPGLTTCASSSSSLPPSSPPPITTTATTNTKYTTHFTNLSSASLPVPLPSSSSFSSSSPASASSLIILHHHYPNKKYKFTPAPPRDRLCRLRLGRLEKRLRRMKSEGELTACDEPPDEQGPGGPSLGKEEAVVGDEVDELADAEGEEVVLCKGEGVVDGELWDPFGDEVEL